MALTVVASATTAGGVTLASENASRGGLIIENSDANRLHVLLDGGSASTSNFSFSLAQNQNAFIPGYTGVVKGIWAADGSGSAFVTEISR